MKNWLISREGFCPPPDLPSKTLPSMSSYFSFYTTGIHSWKVWMSLTFSLKIIWWFHSHFWNFTYKQSQLFGSFDSSDGHLSIDRDSLLPLRHLNLASMIIYVWYTVFLSICTGTCSYHEKSQPKWKVKISLGNYPHLSQNSSHHLHITFHVFWLGHPYIYINLHLVSWNPGRGVVHPKYILRMVYGWGYHHRGFFPPGFPNGSPNRSSVEVLCSQSQWRHRCQDSSTTTVMTRFFEKKQPCKVRFVI